MTAPDTVGERLARIETKLDAWLTQQSNTEIRVQANHTDHEARIRRLERAVWAAASVSAVGGGGLVALVRQLMGG